MIGRRTDKVHVQVEDLLSPLGAVVDYHPSTNRRQHQEQEGPGRKEPHGNGKGRQGKARKGETRQGKARRGQGKARQGKARQTKR